MVDQQNGSQAQLELETVPGFRQMSARQKSELLRNQPLSENPFTDERLAMVCFCSRVRAGWPKRRVRQLVFHAGPDRRGTAAD